ncbi:MAG TPA: peptidoglycan-binding protein [Stellaceae bacterium]|nr:peptidoglycan-binding protein [Stellaceae bacterium]
MRIIAFVLGIWLLGTGTAAAFDCANATLPSSIVICSDPELQRLADERQAAFNAARERLSKEQMEELFESQKAWVRSYATACGVPPDRLPPVPVPASVKECFKRAGAARVAYIRSYGQRAAGIPSPTPVQGPSNRIGPGFDCSKAIHLFAHLICADSKLSRLDIRFNQAYWALYQQVGPEGQPELKQDDSEFIAGISERCGLPQSGVLTPEVWRARGCIENAYEQKRQAWLARLTGPAYEEAVRPPELAIALQRDLERLGFAPASLIDGVYSPVMRAGIETWQSARGVPVTGILGDADAAALAGTVSQKTETTSVGQSPPRDQGPAAGNALEAAISGDEELWGLAVERRKVLEEAKPYLSPEQQKALLADESRWFAAYGEACGIAPGTAATVALTAKIRDCLVRAGRARIAYLRAYIGQSPATSPSASSGAPAPAGTAPAPAEQPPSTASSRRSPAPPVAQLPSAPLSPQPAMSKAPDASAPIPADEQAFIDVVHEARQKYEAASNDMAKGGVRAWRKEAICRTLSSLEVMDWKGTIYNLSSNSDGKGVVEISIAPDIYVETMNNAFSDIPYHTLIDPGSDVFQKLSAMRKGDEVIFSGEFPSSDVDCTAEASVTQAGSMTEPEFLFRFSSISAPEAQLSQ